MAAPTNEDPIERQIVRVLFILYYCHDDEPLLFPSEFNYAHWLDSETKLQKIDFWIRYPDHLAAALLTGLEPKGRLQLRQRSDEIRLLIRDIFQNEEPRRRWVPMHKYMRGAYESLNEVMVFLFSHDLVYCRRPGDQKNKRYYLAKPGQRVVEGLLAECGESKWYERRCRVIDSFFGYLNGFEIRKLQYLQGNYANAPWFKILPLVEAEVRVRFKQVFGEEI